MGDYFSPLRRKVGIVTLVVACVLTAGWVRSLHYADGVSLYATVKYIGSTDGVLLCEWSPRDEMFSEQFAALMHCEFSSDDESHAPYPSPENRMCWRRHLCGISVGAFNERNWCRLTVFDDEQISPSPDYCEAPTGFCTIPYWSIVTPLTLLSAYLLLSRPHPAKPTGSKT